MHMSRIQLFRLSRTGQKKTADLIVSNLPSRLKVDEAAESKKIRFCRNVFSNAGLKALNQTELVALLPADFLSRGVGNKN